MKRLLLLIAVALVTGAPSWDEMGGTSGLRVNGHGLGGGGGLVVPSGAAAAACDANLPTANLKIDLDAADLNGNDDGNTGWSDNDEIGAGGAHWTNAGSVSDSFEMNNAADRPQIQIPCDVGTSGKPCVYFAGVDGLASAHASDPGTVYAWIADSATTIYAVIENTTSASRVLLMNIQGTVADDNFLGQGVYASAGSSLTPYVRLADGDGDALYPTTGTFSGANDYAADTTTMLVWQWQAIGAGTDLELFAISTSVATKEPLGDPLGSGSTSQQLTTGCRGSSSTCNDSYFNGYVFRLLVYDEHHDASTRSTVKTALENCYNAFPN